MYHKLLTSLAGVALALIVAGTAALAASESDIRLVGGSSGVGAVLTDTATITGTPTVTTTPTPTGTTPMTGQQKIASALAARFGVSLDDILEIRADTGWGNVFKIFLLASLSGKTPAEILAMRQDDHQGWGVIYDLLGVKPGHKDNLGQTLKGAKTTPTATVAPSAVPNQKPVPSFTPAPSGGKKPAVPPGQNKPKSEENGKGEGKGRNK